MTDIFPLLTALRVKRRVGGRQGRVPSERPAGEAAEFDLFDDLKPVDAHVGRTPCGFVRSHRTRERNDQRKSFPSRQTSLPRSDVGDGASNRAASGCPGGGGGDPFAGAPRRRNRLSVVPDQLSHSLCCEVSVAATAWCRRGCLRGHGRYARGDRGQGRQTSTAGMCSVAGPPTRLGAHSHGAQTDLRQAFLLTTAGFRGIVATRSRGVVDGGTRRSSKTMGRSCGTALYASCVRVFAIRRHRSPFEWTRNHIAE